MFLERFCLPPQAADEGGDDDEEEEEEKEAICCSMLACSSPALAVWLTRAQLALGAPHKYVLADSPSLKNYIWGEKVQSYHKQHLRYGSGGLSFSTSPVIFTSDRLRPSYRLRLSGVLLLESVMAPFADLCNKWNIRPKTPEQKDRGLLRWFLIGLETLTMTLEQAVSGESGKFSVFGSLLHQLHVVMRQKTYYYFIVFFFSFFYVDVCNYLKDILSYSI